MGSESLQAQIHDETSKIDQRQYVTVDLAPSELILVDYQHRGNIAFMTHIIM
jgi:hypothetical protein